MKKFSTWIGPLLLAAVAFGACNGPSVQGIANSENVVFDAALLGVWFDDDTRFEVEKGEDGRYLVKWVESEGEDDEEWSPELDVAVVRVGEHLVADVMLSEDELEELRESRYGPFVVPIHYFAHLQVEEEALALRFFENDWLKKELGARGIDHYELHGDRIMTAGPEKLRDLLADAIVTEGAMDDDKSVLTRTRED